MLPLCSGISDVVTVPSSSFLVSSSNCVKEKIIYNNYVIYVNTDRRQPSVAGDCLSVETFILIVKKIITSLFRNYTPEGFFILLFFFFVLYTYLKCFYQEKCFGMMSQPNQEYNVGNVGW